MDKKQFSLWVMALKTYYPDPKLIPDENASKLWFIQLQDIDYKLAETALNKWVAGNKWPPTIADIRESAYEVVKGDGSDWSEGWGDVIRVISHYGMYREEQALMSLDETTRKVVKRLGFKNLCLSENLTADRANFRDIWIEVDARDKKMNLIPGITLNQIGAIRSEAAASRLEDKTYG